MPDQIPTNENPSRIPRRWIVAEVASIFLLFFVLAGWPTPDVNEAHYLAKAKHVWNPDWCPRDQFLNSAYAHIVFYWLFGWLTALLPLPAVAWIGRCATWLLLAIAWWRLVFRLTSQIGIPLLTAGLALCLWSRCTMAGEWVVGGVEAKGIAYVFVFWALADLVANRWSRVWLLLGAASAFHVLVGGWSVVACAACWFIQPKNERPTILVMLPSLLGGLVLALPGILPSLLLTNSIHPKLVAAANHVYVFERLAHHLVLHRFPSYLVARHLSCVAVWALLWWLSKSNRKTSRLNGYVLGTVLIAMMGALLDAVLRDSNDAAGALRLYWFRLADIAVPLGICGSLGVLLPRWRTVSSWFPRIVVGVVAIVSLGSYMEQYLRRQSDPRPGAEIQSRPMRFMTPDLRQRRYQAWLDACGWIQRNTPRDALFLTPLRQQTFKWFAERSEVVTWKDVPQSAASLIEWNRRRLDVQALSKPLAAFPSNERAIRELSEKYGFQYVVVEHGGNLPPWRISIVYSNSAYAVLELQHGVSGQR